MDLSKVVASELMAWGLANLWKQGDEGGYCVRHGCQPVNDFGHPRRDEKADGDHHNYFKKAFPCLFPYGRGGLEFDRPREVSFNRGTQLLHHFVISLVRLNKIASKLMFIKSPG
jgi:hypothetical protein